jgi:hypothetical protein
MLPLATHGLEIWNYLHLAEKNTPLPLCKNAQTN